MVSVDLCHLATNQNNEYKIIFVLYAFVQLRLHSYSFLTSLHTYCILERNSFAKKGTNSQ